MFDLSQDTADSLVDQLSSKGYPPAQAARHLADGEYTEAVEICRSYLAQQPQSLSARLTFAIALYRSKQAEAAAEQFYHVLSLDPNNTVALKHLGDIKFAEGDEVAAVANYERILEIDPDCRELISDLTEPAPQPVRTITLKRESESDDVIEETSIPRRDIPFYTETIGDLYLEQGHFTLAAEVYRRLNERHHNPRLAEKLSQARQRVRTVKHSTKEDN